MTNSVKTINEWLDKGFISRNATGMKAEDTTQAFIKGEYPIYHPGLGGGIHRGMFQSVHV